MTAEAPIASSEAAFVAAQKGVVGSSHAPLNVCNEVEGRTE